jgi:hypothetical protein
VQAGGDYYPGKVDYGDSTISITETLKQLGERGGHAQEGRRRHVEGGDVGWTVPTCVRVLTPVRVPVRAPSQAASTPC